MILGVDFGAPRWARDQRRKIIAIAAQRTSTRAYRVDTTGVNARLLRGTPGWSARELLDQLFAQPARVVGFDFPFCVPAALLDNVHFAAGLGSRVDAFGSWRAFSAYVADHLPLTDPLDFSHFSGWRAPSQRARHWTKRATDLAVSAQPPLKDRFQSTFQMTLLGNVLLAKLWESKLYRILPFPGGDGAGEVIEVYPRATLRARGLIGYKSRPEEAVQLARAACADANVELEVDAHVLEMCCRYSSGGTKPDYDAADAFVALCTAILHAEGATRAADGNERDGAIWVPSLGSSIAPHRSEPR